MVFVVHIKEVIENETHTNQNFNNDVSSGSDVDNEGGAGCQVQ